MLFKKIWLSLLLLLFTTTANGLTPPTVFAKSGVCRDGDCENGKGRFEYDGGMVYSGEWRQGKEHGRGVMTMPSGIRYEGDYRHGLPHGWGTYSLPDGRRYVGEWQDGHPEGQGIETQPVGISYEGRWRNGVPQGPAGKTAGSSRMATGWTASTSARRNRGN